MKNKMTHRLNPLEKKVVIDLVAAGYSNRAAASKFRELTKKGISHVGIQYYRKKHAVEIGIQRQVMMEKHDLSEAIFTEQWVRLLHLSELADELYEKRNYPEFRKYMDTISRQLGEQTPQIILTQLAEQKIEESGGGIESVLSELEEAIGSELMGQIKIQLDKKMLESMDGIAGE